MKTNFFSAIITLVFLSLLSQSVSAQSDSCIIKLKSASTSYDQDDYDLTIKLLLSTLNECKLDKADKIQAYKLLILSYLKIDNLEAADDAAAKIMKIDPNYKPDKFKDDPKLSALFEKYKPAPMFLFGLSVGYNQSFVSAEKTYSIVHNDDESQYASYKNKGGFQIGVQFEGRAYKNLWAELGLRYRQSNYEHRLDSVEQTTVNYSEKMSYFDLPLSVKYYIPIKRLYPYVQAGACFSFLTNALSTTTRDDLKDIVNRTDYRNSFMLGYFGGAGLAYRLKGFQAFVDFRYTAYSDLVNKEGTRYDDLTNVFKYYYIDDDFTMNNMQVNFGVNYTLMYKNKKVK
ncbi:MAG: PorT family protein [Bacteroidetes bacterium]|nr:PorT family protein [Bacteroidota bacterium]